MAARSSDPAGKLATARRGPLPWPQLVLGVVLVLGACGARTAGLPIDADGGSPVEDGGAGPVDAPDAGSGGDPDAGPPDVIAMCGAEPTTLADWERCYHERFCELALSCGSMNLYRDVQECIELGNAVSGGRLDHEARERGRAIAAGRAALDEGAFTRCLADMDPASCLNPDSLLSCAVRFAGTTPDHQSCYSDIECASPGAECSTGSCGDACCLGVCQPRRTLGDRCVAGDDCEPGQRCSLDQYCVTGDVGSPCDDSGDCDQNNWCDPVAGACKADVLEGAPCLLLTQCGGETSCVGVRRRAAPAACRRVNVEGDACDYVCLGNLYCDLSGTTGFGVCRSLPKHGESCGLFLPCMGRTEICQSGTCVTRPGVGEPCFEGVCLPGLFCTDPLDPANPTCQLPLADGEGACNQPDQCQSYICDKDATGQCQSWVGSCP